MNTEQQRRNQTKVLRVFFRAFAESSPGFTAKPRRARRFREKNPFLPAKDFSLRSPRVRGEVRSSALSLRSAAWRLNSKLGKNESVDSCFLAGTVPRRLCSSVVPFLL